ncbi:MAG: cyclodeaminase/cyclohydrolase family protein [Firmicutes bacterium]|nr:cyclodeaminase/cyclohydrolase family protein [Bacillota bacterium]
MYPENPLSKFVNDLASRAPAPGGGGAAALAGALGAALTSMVCNLTIGNKKYAPYEEEVKAILTAAQDKLTQLQAGIDEDVQAFNPVSAAYGMPKGTEEEKKARSAAIQEALKKAAGVPLEVAKLALDVLELNLRLFPISNVNVVSDIGVGVLMAEAALEGAALNVEVNLSSIKDEAFNEKMRQQLDPLRARGRAIQEQLLEMVEKRIKGQ